MHKVLIAGIAGRLGRFVARRLRVDHEVIGTDRQKWKTRIPGVPFHRADLRSRAFENVLRTERPDAIVHLGLVRHFRDSSRERFDVNVRGTRRLLDLCGRYEIRRLVVLSTSYVYGALPDNPTFIDEEHPLSASRNYPEIRDLVEVDAAATAYMWRHAELETAILRTVPILGHYVESTMKTYLALRPVPIAMGFNPMIQFIHEDDVADAIALSIDKDLRGIYNVTGPGAVPLHTAIRETGGRPLPLPETLLRLYSARYLGLASGAIDFIKYPCTLSGERFESATGFRPRRSLKETFRSVRPS